MINKFTDSVFFYFFLHRGGNVMRKTPVKVLLFMVTLMLVIIIGCENKKSSASPVQASESSESIGTVELNVAFVTGWDSLTPFRGNVGRNAPFAHILYESLAVVSSEKIFEPWAAKTWTTNDNGFTYDIEIHDKINDSAGNHITAADIVWFIEESKETALKPAFRKVISVSQTGDYTLQVKLNSNIIGVFEWILSDTFIISRTAFEASSDGFNTSVVSTSPYLCTKFVAGSGLSFEKRKDYWYDENLLPECVRPQVDKINFLFITEPSQMGIALETGVIDIAMDLASSSCSQFLNNSDYTVEFVDSNQGYQLFFSGVDTSPCANNTLLRQAICYAIDINGMIKGAAGGFASPMYDVCAPAIIGFNNKWKNEPYYGYDLNKAKDLLSRSGYKGEKLELLVPPYALMPKAGEIIQSYLMEAGINCSINSVDMALFGSMLFDGTKYDMVIHSIGGVFLSDHWSSRYDMAAYSTGDATGRHDKALAELLYKTWTPEGWTEENIDKVHYYLRDNAIAYGFLNPQLVCVWNNKIGLIKEVKEVIGYIAPAASMFSRK
jgi:ABC-type transport system substrate-binding protein